MASDLTVNPVIELGGDFEPASSMDAVAGGRGHDRRRWSLAPAALAILALVSLSASAARAAPAVRRVATVTAIAGGTFMKIGSEIVIADVRDGHNAMTAYSLPDGRRLWSTKLTVLANNLSLERQGDLVIAGFHNAYVSGDLTNAVDLRTGAMAWHSSGDLIKMLPAAGGALMMDLIPVGDGSARRLMMTDIATGEVRWSRDWPVDCATNLAAHLVVVCPGAGTLDLLDPISGRLIGHRAVDLGFSHSHPGMSYPTGWIKLAEQDGVVVVTHVSESGFHMDGYSTSGLAHLWHGPFSGTAWLQPCGQALCMWDEDSQARLDPHTGKALPILGLDMPAGTDANAGPGAVGPRDRIALIPEGMREYGGATSVPEFRDGMATGVPEPTRVDSWIASVAVARRAHPKPVVTPLLRLPGVGVGSCVLIRPYLACAADRAHLTFYDVSALVGTSVGGAG